jgi:Uncharacterized protein conserved in bacteria (DUF2066)
MGFGASKGLVLGLCLALGLMAAPAQADDDTPYTVSKIDVDVTAKNAVAAKAKAMADAQKRGIDTVLRRVVPFSFSAKLPDLQPQQVETLVNGMAIRKEQYSTTRYIATLDVIFNEQGVKELLTSLGIPTSEERAPMISVLPLVIDGNKVKSVNEAWRQAWLDLDLTHGLTPANVLQPRPELEAGMVRAVLAGDAGAFAAVQRDYGSAPLIIAVGQKVEGGHFVTRLAGTDGVGRINYGRSDKLSGTAPKAARDAASFAYAVLENRWKATRAAPDPVAAPVNYEEGGTPPPQAAPQQGEPGRLVTAVVVFAGLKEWQQIRGRLAQVPGLQRLEVNSLSARTASITFDYAGSLGHLQQVLGQSGFSFENREEAFVLRAR